MRGLARLARLFGHDEAGATAVEYALIAGLIALGVLASLIALGGGTGESWNNTAQRVGDAMRGQ
jgi:pilus assembly protein Flp/PilA